MEDTTGAGISINARLSGLCQDRPRIRHITPSTCPFYSLSLSPHEQFPI